MELGFSKGQPRMRSKQSSWIPPSISWKQVDDLFWFSVPINADDLLKFIAHGFCEVTAPKRGDARRRGKLLREGVQGQLFDRLGGPAGWKAASRAGAGRSLIAYCHGVFKTLDPSTVCVLAGPARPNGMSGWISKDLSSAALVLFKAGEDEQVRKPESHAGGSWPTASLSPEPTIKSLIGLLPSVLAVDTAPVLDDKIDNAAAGVLNTAGALTSRDGTYEGLLRRSSLKKVQGLILHEPYVGPPSYPEVRWAVLGRIPSAVFKPRRADIARAEFGDAGPRLDLSDLGGALDDLSLDDDRLDERAGEVKGAISDGGFEAFAWYQSWHIWNEETWGIYLDAGALDRYALSLHADCKAAGVVCSQDLAAHLAINLIYEHELFHARVEAGLAWMELSALQPRYKRYKSNVYNALEFSPDWLEEALANWASWAWFQSPSTRAVLSDMGGDPDKLAPIIESSLDLSPEGYKEWRKGEDLLVRRLFMGQLASGRERPDLQRLGLPIESLLDGPYPFDLRTSDVPFRFVGSGQIAERLLSNPAIFNVPTRREVEKVLKFFGYEHEKARGKGSHEGWIKPGKGTFPLPTRDPLSQKVFRALLDHLGLTKQQYVWDIRPKI